MNENPLVLNEDALNGFQVNFTQGKVEIVGYNEIYKSLCQLSDYLENIEVTENNIKENKKLVARIAKATKEMNQARIDNKRKFMQPFDVYEMQVKTLTELVKTAEETVRDQIRELEEIEREQKENRLREIFEKRIKHYDNAGLMEFDNFLKPKYLNKTATIDSTEREMVDWIETFDRDVKLLEQLSEAQNFDVDEAINLYIKKQNLSQVLEHFSTINKQKEKVKEHRTQRELKAKKLDQDTITIIMNKDDFYQKIEPVIIGMGLSYICA